MEHGLTFEYESAELGERLTVSIFLATPRLEASELDKVFDDFLRARRDAEVKEDSELELMDTKVKRPNASITGFYQGRSKAQRFVGNFTIVNSAGIANFYYEATKLPPPRFAERVQAILGDLTFVQ